MKKRIIIFSLLLIGLLGLIFILNNGEDNSEDIVRPEFVTSISEIDDQLPTVIMFKKPTCEDCTKMEIIYKRLHEEYDGKFNIVYYDADEFTNIEIQNAIDTYEVQGTPTSIIMKSNRKVISKLEGLVSAEEVEKVLIEAGLQAK